MSDQLKYIIDLIPFLLGLAISREIILFSRVVGNNGKRRDLMENTGKYREVICPLEKSFDVYYSDPEGPFHMFQDNEI